MTRRKTVIENDDHNRWIVSYSDFITLLFAFFVVLYAMSTINNHKYKQVSSSLGGVFQSKKSPPAAKKPPLPKLDQDIAILPNQEWTTIEIKANTLFMPGETTLTDSALSVLDSIAKKLKNANYSVRVEGHTDSIPINSDQFPSNWELSASRAATVARILIQEGMDPKRVSAIGYADQQPIASNDTPEGRMKNRRVVLVIAKIKEVPTGRKDHVTH
jgi:chemotaxis protein MotB